MKNKIMVNKIQDEAKLNLTSFTMCLYKCLCIIDFLKFMSHVIHVKQDLSSDFLFMGHKTHRNLMN